jgi:hypothetical protein
VLRRPITHDEALETKLILEDVVLEVRVLASIAVVDLVVGAHNRASACADGLSKRPDVKFVLKIVSLIPQNKSCLNIPE